MESLYALSKEVWLRFVPARRYSVCEEPVCTEQGSADLM